jgi:hypothetical protein
MDSVRVKVFFFGVALTGCWGSPELNSAVDNLNVPKVSAFGMKMLQGLHQEPYGRTAQVLFPTIK